MTTSTVLLTATVRPNTSLFLAQADPTVRLAQYQYAIAEWVEHADECDADVLIVETSGARARELLARVPSRKGRNVQVISHDVGDLDVSRGKGVFEADAIRRGVESAEQEFGAARTIFKGTGRLVVRNAPRLLHPLPAGTVQVRMTADRSYADTRFLGAAADDWRNVLLADVDRIDERERVFFEHVVAGAVARAAAIKQVRIERFARRPLFQGQSGSTGRTYKSALSRAISGVARVGEDGLARLANRKQV